MTRSHPRVYLDHNATSPLRPQAMVAMRRVLEGPQANPSSLHEEGRSARATVEAARRQVAKLAGCDPGEVVFTSSGSEAIAAAVRGVCDRVPAERKRILVGAMEHSAVLESARLAARRGLVVVPVACGREGRVRVDRFLMHLDDDVALAAVQWANNETGVIQPVEEIGAACRKRGIPFLVDAVQAAGKIPLDPRRAFADVMALSAHKVGGPQGAGALFVRRGLSLAPLVGGGAQERRRRAGTEAVAALAGWGAAAEAAHIELKAEGRRLLQLRAKLETRMRENFPGIRYHGQSVPRLPNTISFALPGIPGETLAIALDLDGFALSTGSACASGAVEPSHVLMAMGQTEEQARSAMRLSMGWSSTEDETDRFLARFSTVVGQVRAGIQRGDALAPG